MTSFTEDSSGIFGRKSWSLHNKKLIENKGPFKQYVTLTKREVFDQKKLISLSSNFVCLWKTSCLKVKKGIGIYADYFIFDKKISQQGRGSLNSAEYVSRTIWMDPKTKIKKTQQYKPRKETRSCGSFFFSFFVAE